MADQYTDPHDGTVEPEPEWEEEWRTHREWMETERQDTLIRHGHTFTACVVCHERAALSIYGCKCQVCFETQRDEREAA